MANGEVVFEAPWQGRVFGMARTLAEAGLYGWEDFRRHLIREIAIWDRSSGADCSADEEDEYRYYDHFLKAFQALLEEKNLLDRESLETRFTELSSRPHDHDH